MRIKKRIPLPLNTPPAKQGIERASQYGYSAGDTTAKWLKMKDLQNAQIKQAQQYQQQGETEENQLQEELAAFYEALETGSSKDKKKTDGMRNTSVKKKRSDKKRLPPPEGTGYRVDAIS